MKSVLFITKSFLPITGGVQEHIYYVSRELKNRGLTVEIAFFWKKVGDYPADEAGVHVLQWATLWQRACSLVQLSRCMRLVDIIHLHDYTAFYYALPAVLLAKFSGKPVYITFHGWEGQCPPAKLTILLRRFCNWVCDGSINVGHYIEKWYGTISDFVIYGATVTVAKAQPKGIQKVAFLGRLDSDTNIFMVLNAWKLIAQRYPNATLDIIGDGKLGSRAHEFVKRENISGISFKGWVSDPASVLFGYSVVIPAGYLAMLLSFACECAVVACYGNSLKEDYFRLIPDFDRMAWACGDANAVADAVADAFNGASKSAVAKAFVDSCTWESVADVYQYLWAHYDPPR